MIVALATLKKGKQEMSAGEFGDIINELCIAMNLQVKRMEPVIHKRTAEELDSGEELEYQEGSQPDDTPVDTKNRQTRNQGRKLVTK